MNDDDLTPQDEEVRRLLADARHEEPAPAEVVARLDRVLAGLAAEPVRIAPVTALATRRRRAASLLVAAAAVVAVGIGVDQVVLTGSGQDSMSSLDRDEPAGVAGDRGLESAPRPKAHQDSATSRGNLDGGASGPMSANGRAPQELARLRERSLTADAAAVREQAGSGDFLAGLSAYDAAGRTCRSGAWGRGRFVPVRYAGLPAVLVFRRVLGDAQVADLFLCGESEPHRSVTLPAP